MAAIVYAEKCVNRDEAGFTRRALQTLFSDAVQLDLALRKANLRVAYSFVDPLLHGFEAGNRFYFDTLGLINVGQLSYYRTGCGPIQALGDAKRLLETGSFDAVFIFGCEPLLHQKKTLGKEAVAAAMDIFNGASLVACYHSLAAALCRREDIEPGAFMALADALYQNYSRSYQSSGAQEPPRPRGRGMEAEGAPMFRLTDCANPNVNFAGGVVLGNDRVVQLLGLGDARLVRVKSVAQQIVKADPQDPLTVLGRGDELFPHLRRVFAAVQEEAGLNLAALAADNRLMLDAYTCYPPIPLAFLLAGGFIQNWEELPEFAQRHELTLEGGLSLAGAPWNNPVLSSLVTFAQRLPGSGKPYGLLHGNGGIGEAQGLALLELPG